MLRHFKMELKRQQLDQQLQQQMQQQQQAAAEAARAPIPAAAAASLMQPNVIPRQSVVVAAGAPSRSSLVSLNHGNQINNNNQNQIKSSVCDNQLQLQQQQVAAKPIKPKRVRGRRSSKPMMEKRRRARINECLDILKSYVLTDSTNLTRLGIDATASENQDEETIARCILKTSGLINRHRGRKNPNKLEKADILELTVDYVRRLHEQRDELLLTNNNSQLDTSAAFNQQMGQQIVPAHLSEPLTLDLSPQSRTQTHLSSQRIPPTPPPSSASSSPNVEQKPFGNNNQQQVNPYNMILSQVLDGYGINYNWATSMATAAAATAAAATTTTAPTTTATY